MAITRAQQAKQLLANGGRIGLFLGGNFEGGYSESRKDSGKTAPTVSYSGSGDGSYDSPPQKFVLTPKDRKIITSGGGRNDPPLTEVEKFVQDSADYPIFTPAYVKTAADFNRIPNRKFLVERVLKGPNADRIIKDALGLEEEDEIPTVNDLSEKQLEKVMDSYMPSRLAGETDAMGNPIPDTLRGDRDENNFIPPIIPEGGEGGEGGDADDVNADDQGIINYRLMADGGMTNDAPAYEGGIMDLESGRQQYFLGKLVKKVTRGVKKIVKSPIGKAALTAALFKFGGGFGKGPGSAFVKLFGANNTMPGFENVSTAKMGGILEKLGLTKGYGSIMPTALGGIAASTLGSYFLTPEEEKNNEELNAGADLPFPVEYYLSGKYKPNARLAADGGIMRLNYAEGSEEPVAKKTMPLLDMDGQEMDLREEGGFVPLGRMERADDVPARLSKNEFVFTADAVRNAGEGDVDKGAEVMYNMMKNLESGGEVSEESQGLEGAREMFQTSQRLEEVI